MNTIKLFRYIGQAEAISFLLLLGVAMPLKYGLGISEAVKYVGWAHGLLFILYIAAAFLAFDKYDWSLKKLALAVAASLLPFGPFIFDKKYL